jgi:hypothetical protein
MIGNNSANARKVFPVVNLDEYGARYASAGRYYGDDYTILNGSARGLFIPMSESRTVYDGKKRLVVVFQNYRTQSGTATQYVSYQYKTIFEQREDGIYAWCASGVQSRSGEVNSSLYFWGMNMDAMFSSGDSRLQKAYMGYDNTDVVAGDFYKGYGLDEVALYRLSGCNDEISYPGSYAESLTVEDGKRMVVNESGDCPYAIHVDGELVISNSANLALSGKITGCGTLAFSASEPRFDVTNAVWHSDSEFLTGDWTLVATNRLLASLVSVTGRITGARITAKDRYTAAICHMRNDGGYATVQFFAPKTAKRQCAVLLQMKQCGPDIKAYITPFTLDAEDSLDKSFGGSYEYGDFDLEEDRVSQFIGLSSIGTPIASSDTASSVGLSSLGLLFEEGSAPYNVSLWGENRMDYGSVLNVSGENEAYMIVRARTLKDNYALSQNGVVDVDRGGVLFLEKAVYPKELRIHDGGVVFQATNNPFSSFMPLTIDGGSLYLGYQEMNKGRGRNQADAYTYLNQVRLMNGACIYGCRARIGNNNSPMWTVGGLKPSRATCGMSINSLSMGPMRFDVADVTGDDNVDFTMEGDIVLGYGKSAPEYEERRNIYVLKEGSGTMSMNAAFSPYYPTVVSNGVWRFGVPKSASASTDFKLDGGNLEVADGIALTMGEVIPSVASTITLGEGASLSIKAPTADWPEDGSVNFVVSDIASRSSIRFGESASLSAAHLGAIRVNGKIAAQNSAGYLRPVAFRVIVR